MKKTIASVLFLFLFGGCNEGPKVPTSIQEVIPNGYDINSPLFSHAKEEILENVAECGKGVVSGVSGENKCSFQIKIDELFLRHPADKTGFIPNEHWAYRDDVSFVSAADVGPLPDSFDLRDFMKNGHPPIFQQNCGDCWAQATNHSYEIAQSINGVNTPYSIQTVLSCSHEGSCGGGDMAAVDFLHHGLPLATDFPYTGHDSRCKYSSTDITKGWEPKMVGTPYVGNSLSYSRAKKIQGVGFGSHPTALQMMEAIYKFRAPLVVTVDAYSMSGPGIYDRCSSVNSGGNHMVAIVGWDKEGGHYNAHVYNSWGLGHGKDGVSRIKWECGAPGKLNRGLGVSAKVVQYKPACEGPVVSLGAAKHVLFSGNSVKLGKNIAGQTCKWTPTVGLSDPNSCETYASPEVSTEYHVTATNSCATASAMTLVERWGPNVLTPFGTIPSM